MDNLKLNIRVGIMQKKLQVKPDPWLHQPEVSKGTNVIVQFTPANNDHISGLKGEAKEE